jgi:hypothetical protein
MYDLACPAGSTVFRTILLIVLPWFSFPMLHYGVYCLLTTVYETESSGDWLKAIPPIGMPVADTVPFG